MVAFLSLLCVRGSEQEEHQGEFASGSCGLHGNLCARGMSNSLMHFAQFIPQNTVFCKLPTGLTKSKKGGHAPATESVGLREEEGSASLSPV